MDDLLLFPQLPLPQADPLQDAQVGRGLPVGLCGRLFGGGAPVLFGGGLFGGAFVRRGFGCVDMDVQIHLHLQRLCGFLRFFLFQQGEGDGRIAARLLPHPLFQFFLEQPGQKPEGRQTQTVLPHHRHILFAEGHIRGIHCRSVQCG